MGLEQKGKDYLARLVTGLVFIGSTEILSERPLIGVLGIVLGYGCLEFIQPHKKHD